MQEPFSGCIPANPQDTFLMFLHDCLNVFALRTSRSSSRESCAATSPFKYVLVLASFKRRVHDQKVVGSNLAGGVFVFAEL